MKAKISKERQVNTYAEMWHASDVMLGKAKENPEGSFYQLMASLIFTAFTLEAYLNHIGQSIFKCWDDLEQLSPKRKLNLIAEKLKIERDDSKRPFQTVSKLFKFRNDIAHGKTVRLKSENQINVVDLDYTLNVRLGQHLETPWQKYCSLRNAERAREDVKIIIQKLHKAAGVTDHILFSFGQEVGMATLSLEESSYQSNTT
ncbi:MAG: hypothetical protein MUO97_00050 [Dehalococcoidia bacterium]|nr:hypothetical protein [Dehalococcoidia bacterium]